MGSTMSSRPGSFTWRCRGRAVRRSRSTGSSLAGSKIGPRWLGRFDRGALGVPIHFGEMGCYKHTPPEVVLAWFDDTLSVLNDLPQAGRCGTFRRPFGILDAVQLRRIGARTSVFRAAPLRGENRELLRSSKFKARLNAPTCDGFPRRDRTEFRLR